MFAYLRDVFRRHRRKFIFIGVFSAASVLLWKYAQRRLKEWQENEAAECLAFARRQHHFDSNQRTCNMTVLAMLPTIRQSLTKILDSDDLTQQLKNRPANKLEIWEQLKIISFSRPIAAVYSLCMVIVYLRVQLNVLGGYMYLDSFHGNNGTIHGQSQATPEIQKQYLATIQYLMGNGLKDIVEATKNAVEECIGKMSLKKSFQLQDLEHLLGKIRRKLEVWDNSDFSNGSTSLTKYFLPPEENGGLNEEELNAKWVELQSEEETTIVDEAYISQNQVMLHRLSQETRDMIESADFCQVLNTCLDTAFTRLMDNIACSFKPKPEQTHFDVLSISPCDTSLPLAKLIPVMNGQVHFICGDSPNHFVQELLLMECVKDFAANVYEAFSQSEHTAIP
ncbi:peroxisomal biogenesis factor 3-like [Anneissia japonica]|uniref:peroxisomal biogenesis factor 3-like n=1 Tax=Anneissia japonica TaxID=1529436 RepID=UPI001425AB35|nr:peroxisomal biogenesis factor 3-like [Anneissia japonica]